MNVQSSGTIIDSFIFISTTTTTTNMGNQNATHETLNDYDIRLLSQQTQIPPHIMQQLYEAFRERAGRNGR